MPYPSLDSAIASQEWSSARNLILRKHAKDRSNVGLPDSSDLTLLQLAALYEPSLAVKLLDSGFECDLHSACALGLPDRIQELADESSLGELAEHLPPLGWALVRGKEQSIDALLKSGDDPSRPLKRIGFFLWEIQVMHIATWYPIHVAATHGYLDSAPRICRQLIEAGADIELLSPLGLTPLAMACIYSWIEVLKELVSLGADIDARSQAEHDLVWELSAPRRASRISGRTPLMVAVGEGQLKTVKFLIENGCDVNVRDHSGSTALHIAAHPWWEQNPEVVSKLLESGLNPLEPNDDGVTPVDLAATADDEETLRLLRAAS